MKSCTPGTFFGSRYREGSTGFRKGTPVLETLLQAASRVPVVLAVGMDRPADLSRVAPLAAAIVATFGLSAEALLDVLSGPARTDGRICPTTCPGKARAARRRTWPPGWVKACCY